MIGTVAVAVVVVAVVVDMARTVDMAHKVDQVRKLDAVPRTRRYSKALARHWSMPGLTLQSSTASWQNWSSGLTARRPPRSRSLRRKRSAKAPVAQALVAQALVAQALVAQALVVTVPVAATQARTAGLSRLGEPLLHYAAIPQPLPCALRGGQHRP